IGRPGSRLSRPWRVQGRGASGNPYVVIVVNIYPMLTIRPDAACLRLTFASNKSGIGRTTPGAQQLALGIEFQNRRGRSTAIRNRTIGVRLADAIDGLAMLVLCPWHRPFETGLLGSHAAGAIVDPYMIALVDVQPADLAEEPVVRQGLRPRGIDHEARRLA